LLFVFLVVAQPILKQMNNKIVSCLMFLVLMSSSPNYCFIKPSPGQAIVSFI
jgi:hypothetical protein